LPWEPGFRSKQQFRQQTLSGQNLLILMPLSGQSLLMQLLPEERLLMQLLPGQSLLMQLLPGQSLLMQLPPGQSLLMQLPAQGLPSPRHSFQVQALPPRWLLHQLAASARRRPLLSRFPPGPEPPLSLKKKHPKPP
jgi:hypothetical protein